MERPFPTSINMEDVVPVGELMPVVPVAECDRLTSQMALHHQHCGEPPTVVQCTFVTKMEEVAQPYGRRLEVGKVVPLDLGWMDAKKAGYLYIENRSKHPGSVTPTAEELEALEKRVLRIRDGAGPGYLVKPGRFFVAEPVDMGKIKLSSENGDPVTVWITLFPR